MSEKFERIVKFRPAFDKRSSDPSKDYGVGSMNIYMVLRGSKGAISFGIHAGWYLPSVIAWWQSKGYLNYEAVKPSGFDIGYHSKQPIREFQSIDKPSDTHCCYLEDGPCWYDGSGLAGQELFERFIVEGEEVVWQTLEEWYHSEFDSVSSVQLNKEEKK